jgi:clan AA aspartic protease
MITGFVERNEGWIRLQVRGPHATEREVEAIIDTGYTGSLTLSRDLITALGLRWRSVDSGTLADGSECLFDVFEGIALWDGKARQILVAEADTDPLVGMKLLRGFQIEHGSASRRQDYYQAVAAGHG